MFQNARENVDKICKLYVKFDKKMGKKGGSLGVDWGKYGVSGVTGGGDGQGAECPPPRDFWTGNFCCPTGSVPFKALWRTIDSSPWKIGSTDFVTLCKKMLFLGKSAYFQQKLEILAQWPSKIVKILSNWPKLIILRGNTAYRDKKGIKEARKKGKRGENWEEKKENCKVKVENWKWKEES